MFRRTVALVLPLLILACGCMGLRRDREAVEYHPGTPPTTVVADRDATYKLCADEPDTGRPSVDVAKGETVGFRRESDGSLVAIAGTHTYTIPDQHAVWSFVPAPVTRWDRFAVSAYDKGQNTVAAVTIFFLVPFIIYNGCTTGEWP